MSAYKESRWVTQVNATRRKREWIREMRAKVASDKELKDVVPVMFVDDVDMGEFEVAGPGYVYVVIKQVRSGRTGGTYVPFAFGLAEITKARPSSNAIVSRCRS
ncbi:hypothetical protein CALVIDRAFT_530992 [Calocera viscosa TUFC12733]|uniref:Uncharacterized protein n=1 Tax=Calocera viscosa (strain TUFC12733) TaxID=1330018 RepID=A0A167H3A7_CALVF|nr:hypothetical protein CALVIDRAFT_530992 [Calocera viscosa TUFC12733]